MERLLLSKLIKMKQKIRDWNTYSSEIFRFSEKILLEEEKIKWMRQFAQHYFQPDDKEIKNNFSAITDFLKDGQCCVIIPMKERENTIKNCLEYLIKRIPANLILIVNDNSSVGVVDLVKKFRKVLLVDKEKILQIIDWKKLLPVLNLTQIPTGKGITVMAGYLLHYFISKKKNKKIGHWIFQTDADIKDHKKFKALEYLSWGIIKNPLALQVKIAKSGRNNEPHMAVRSSLSVWQDLALIDDSPKIQAISARAVQLFENLAKYKWILGGTFGIPKDVAYIRPFATGYLDETLTCAFIEDLARKESRFSIQISNPNQCSDGENTFQKEHLIIQMTANFVVTLVLAKKPICDWTLDDIAWINKNLMNRAKPIVLIPPKNDERSVIVEVVANERILPSVSMLKENGFINEKKADEIFNGFRIGK